MVNIEKSGYRGKIAFVSWVLGKTIIDKGIDVHPAPQSAIEEIQERLNNLGGGLLKILGGFIEEINLDGSTVSAVRADIEAL